MPDRTYKLEEIVGTSPVGIDEAIQNGLARAAKTIKHLDWFQVVRVRGQIADGDVQYFQVDLKVGFRVLTPEELLSEG